MITTIDQAGRVVIPKAMRDSLGLSSGSKLEVVESEGQLIIRPAGLQVSVEQRRGRPVLVAEGAQTLTSEQVRELTERGRR